MDEVNLNRTGLILLGVILTFMTGCVTHQDAYVNATVNVSGSALGSAMEGYVLEVGSGTDPSNWTTLGVVLADDGESGVNEGLLALWNTSAVSDGRYTLRLTVTDLNGVASQDLVYVLVDNELDNVTSACPAWSCSNLIEGSNSVDVGLTQEQYGNDMYCSITCECPSNMYMAISSNGDIEYGYDVLYLDETSHTGVWSTADSLDNSVDIIFTSDYSIDGTYGYTGFDITGITCTRYCSSGSNDYTEEYISGVKLNDEVKSSSGSYYSDYTSNVFTELSAGQQYTLYVNVSALYPCTEYVKAWIDFNQDYDFNDTGEEINLGSYTVDGTHTFSTTFTVPADAVSGNTRLRVSDKWGSAPSPCETFGYGEVEDYTIEVSGVNLSYEVSVERGLPAAASPNSSFTVTLAMDVNESSKPNAVGVTEYYPSGWTVSNISLEGIDRGDRIEWLFWPMGNPVQDQDITYITTTPGNASGNVSFSGAVDYSGINQTIEGDTVVEVSACELAGDYPPCGEVTLSEVISFINLWAHGEVGLGEVVALINAWVAG